jgi:ABC-type metal ion transport system substrate-binding protein
MSAPYDRLARVGSIVKSGKSIVIPNGVSEFVDMTRLELYKERGLIKFTVKELPTLDIINRVVEIPKSDKKVRKTMKEDS